jgi:DNA-binding NarL/FixJ family response regulator
MIRVLVADDQRVVREGLTLVLGLLPDIDVVGAAGDGNEALALVEHLRPDIVLMDLRMPRCDGVEATGLLCERHPETRVVVLTTYADDRSVIDALRAGARGYLTKDAGGAEIHEALLRVLDDQALIDPAVQHHLIGAIANRSPSSPPARLPDGLTPREAEVLSLIAGGLSNAEIAGRLFISEGTVKSHVNHLLAKIDTRDRAQAVAYACRHWLVEGADRREKYICAIRTAWMCFSHRLIAVSGTPVWPVKRWCASRADQARPATRTFAPANPSSKADLEGDVRTYDADQLRTRRLFHASSGSPRTSHLARLPRRVRLRMRIDRADWKSSAQLFARLQSVERARSNNCSAAGSRLWDPVGCISQCPSDQTRVRRVRQQSQGRPQGPELPSAWVGAGVADRHG